MSLPNEPWGIGRSILGEDERYRDRSGDEDRGRSGEEEAERGVEMKTEGGMEREMQREEWR